MIYGKVPPQARDLEEAVLGAIMLHKQAFDMIADILKPEAFYVDAHQRIFKVMQRLSDTRIPVDLLTVVEYLRKEEELELVGGAYYLTKLTNTVVSSANIETHARIIVQKFIQRELIRVSGEVISVAYEDSADAFEVLDYAEQHVLDIGLKHVGGGTMTMEKVMMQTMNKIEGWRLQDTTVTGTPAGFQEVDTATRGWQPGDLIILAARPSVGKTAFMLNLVRKAAEYFKKRGLKESVAVWSLEMKAYLLGLRMLAAESQTFLFRLQTGRLDQSQMDELYSKSVAKLSELDILFDEDMGINITALRSKIRRLVKKNNLKIVFIDYLQLLTGEGKGGTREQEVSKISRALKLLAQELDIPIVALSQMSRDIEKRKDGTNDPQLSDLRESGAIEQDADVVMFLWAPSEAEILQDKNLQGKRYVKIAKQRNGVLLKTELNFKNEIQLFENFESSGMWRPLTDTESQAMNRTEPNKKDDELPF